MGELGTTIVDPDAVSLDVLNEILNGFGGLLFDQVKILRPCVWRCFSRTDLLNRWNCKVSYFMICLYIS